MIMFWRVRLYLDYSPLFKVKLYKTSWKFWWKWSEALFKVRNSKPVLPHPFLACTVRYSNFFLFSSLMPFYVFYFFYYHCQLLDGMSALCYLILPMDLILLGQYHRPLLKTWRSWIFVFISLFVYIWTYFKISFFSIGLKACMIKYVYTVQLNSLYLKRFFADIPVMILSSLHI